MYVVYVVRGINMKKMLLVLLALSSISAFASEVCTVKTQGANNPLVSCTSKSESNNGPLELEATQNTASTLKILLNRGYVVKSVTSLSENNDVLFLLIKN